MYLHVQITVIQTCCLTASMKSYMHVDLYQLAGNFMKNIQNVAIRIKTSDIKLSLCADVVSGAVDACMYIHVYMYTFMCESLL